PPPPPATVPPRRPRAGPTGPPGRRSRCPVSSSFPTETPPRRWSGAYGQRRGERRGMVLGPLTGLTGESSVAFLQWAAWVQEIFSTRLQYPAAFRISLHRSVAPP